MRNRTGIEDWILEKAIHRRLVAQEKGGAMEPFIYPYHLGVWRNIQQVCFIFIYINFHQRCQFK